MTDLLPSLLRTLVPLIVGWLLSLAARRGLDLDATELTGLVTVACTAIYYLVVRVLEVHAKPAFGWLLGYAKQPVYVSPPAVVQDQDGARLVDDGGYGDPLGLVVTVLLIVILLVITVRLLGGDIG